ncbi:MAG: helix-turn-helix domain-containing protein [Pseudomonadota bacterium]
MAEPKRRETDTSKTRSKIIEATDRLIGEKGLDATSVSAVARSLDMSHANVYRHFKSRGDLLVAVAETWMAETRKASEDAIDLNRTEEDNLVALVLAIRAEMFRRSNNMAALDLYHFALREMPQQAIHHHKHRAQLITQITGAPDKTPAVLDALRAFTDPNLILATEGPDTSARIREVCRLLCAALSSKV